MAFKFHPLTKYSNLLEANPEYLMNRTKVKLPAASHKGLLLASGTLSASHDSIAGKPPKPDNPSHDANINRHRDNKSKINRLLLQLNLESKEDEMPQNRRRIYIIKKKEDRKRNSLSCKSEQAHSITCPTDLGSPVQLIKPCVRKSLFDTVFRAKKQAKEDLARTTSLFMTSSQLCKSYCLDQSEQDIRYSQGASEPHIQRANPVKKPVLLSIKKKIKSKANNTNCNFFIPRSKTEDLDLKWFNSNNLSAWEKDDIDDKQAYALL